MHGHGCDCRAVCLLCNTIPIDLHAMNQHVVAMHRPEQVDDIDMRRVLVGYTPRVEFCEEARSQCYGQFEV